MAMFCTPSATTKRANVLVEEMPTGPVINAFFATPSPPAVCNDPVDVLLESVVSAVLIVLTQLRIPDVST